MCNDVVWGQHQSELFKAFLNIITSVLLGFIWAITGCKVIHNDLFTMTVLRDAQLRVVTCWLRLWTYCPDTPVSHWHEGEVQPVWVILTPPGRGHGFSCHLTVREKWLDHPSAGDLLQHCYSTVPWGTPDGQRKPLGRGMKSYKNIFFNATCVWWSVACFQVVLLLSFCEKSTISTYSRRINKTKSRNLQSLWRCLNSPGRGTTSQLWKEKKLQQKAHGSS